MTVAIVHYHLGPGGVTQVIAAASRAFTAAGIRHVILAGSAPPDSPLPVRIIPALAYPGRDRPPGGPSDDSSLTDQLRAAGLDHLGSPPDIWHFHNHSLGKNQSVPRAVATLAAENERLILQLHDLAEDGRPANHPFIAGRHDLYPFSPRIRYAFLNSRDLATFQNAGLPPQNATLLSNPIPIPASTPPLPSVSPILFAPVRGIRRKNLGELVLLSALAPARTRIAVSRAPLDPDALHIHDTWQKFIARQNLPIAFDVVDRFTPARSAPPTFESWLAHATHIVTTSVAEGFGLPFLEAAAHGKPLIGRNIPHITADHARLGIRSGDLYDHILIPLEWVDAIVLREHLQTTLERNHRLYQRPLTRDFCDAAFHALLHDGWLDFGNLPEPLQQAAIERLADPDSRKTPLVSIHGETRPAASWLATAISNHTPTATPTQLTPFSESSYQKSLVDLLTDLTHQPPSPPRFLPPARILDAHLTPRAFHFLLSAPPPRPAHWEGYRAVIFDIYGTLLIAPAGGVKPDPAADPKLRGILEAFGHEPPESPSTALHQAVLRHHAAATVPHPEIDLRQLWREVLSLDPYEDTTALVLAIEDAWHPCRPMPGAAAFVSRLSRRGISLGLLSNAQCNTLHSLGGIRDFFAPELTLLSYQHGIAKPSPALFELLTERLATRGITPSETLYIGNDPLQDILPAAAAGFKTALFTGHPDSLRTGHCSPDHEFANWPQSQDTRSDS